MICLTYISQYSKKPPFHPYEAIMKQQRRRISTCSYWRGFVVATILLTVTQHLFILERFCCGDHLAHGHPTLVHIGEVLLWRPPCSRSPNTCSYWRGFVVATTLLTVTQHLFILERFCCGDHLAHGHPTLVHIGEVLLWRPPCSRSPNTCSYWRGFVVASTLLTVTQHLFILERFCCGDHLAHGHPTLVHIGEVLLWRPPCTRSPNTCSYWRGFVVATTLLTVTQHLFILERFCCGVHLAHGHPTLVHIGEVLLWRPPCSRSPNTCSYWRGFVVASTFLTVTQHLFILERFCCGGHLAHGHPTLVHIGEVLLWRPPCTRSPNTCSYWRGFVVATTLLTVTQHLFILERFCCGDHLAHGHPTLVHIGEVLLWRPPCSRSPNTCSYWRGFVVATTLLTVTQHLFILERFCCGDHLAHGHPTLVHIGEVLLWRPPCSRSPNTCSYWRGFVVASTLLTVTQHVFILERFCCGDHLAHGHPTLVHIGEVLLWRPPCSRSPNTCSYWRGFVVASTFLTVTQHLFILERFCCGDHLAHGHPTLVHIGEVLLWRPPCTRSPNTCSYWRGFVVATTLHTVTQLGLCIELKKNQTAHIC